jgi:hypothetical protein
MSYAENRKLLKQLEDDKLRAELLADIACGSGHRDFPSRASGPEPCCPDDDNPRPPPEISHRMVRIIAKRELIEDALKDGGREYSSRPYGELGGGKFMLALDPATTGKKAHDAQLYALGASFPQDPDRFGRIAHHACETAAILSLRSQQFDLALFAEQAALRFCQYLFGYASTDFPVLETALRANYHALVYQVLGRHFTTEPLAIETAKAPMGRLLERTAELIDAWADGDEDADALKGCHPPAVLNGDAPVLKKLGQWSDALNGEQRAIVAVGAAAGTTGNVQAAVCIAVKALFADPTRFAAARTLAARERPDQPSQCRHEWWPLIGPALLRNPPIAFVPRTQIVREPPGQTTYREVLLALGGGAVREGDDDSLIWGGWGESYGRHGCIGKYLAQPLITEIVRCVMGLSDLAEKLDPLDAKPVGLDKRWGFQCKSYPLTYRRERRVAQATLNVHMRIKQPVKDNAERLRRAIAAGAPRIHEVLGESRHIHFAWFEFVERDTVLVLHTIYDGDFNAYIQHFALRVGDLFDTLFESIEDAPPMPVNEFPNDFVALIQRHNRAPAMGYFYSAYPKSEAAQIVRDEAVRVVCHKERRR